MLGGVLLVLVALVALLPTIASTAWVRSMVVAKVNKGLNGRLVIDDWSVSWTGGIKVTGVTIDPIKRRDFGLLFSQTAEAVSGIGQDVSAQMTIEATRGE